MIRWVFVFALFAGSAHADTITLASTTSVENTGLLAKILPLFTRKTGTVGNVLALGTGQALAVAARGDADLVLVHDPSAEAAFIAAGHGFNRREIAWNDFLLVGPDSDPARIRGLATTTAAFQAIAATGTIFISRGDSSGTDALEKRLWKAAGIVPEGAWYRDIGGSMGAALNMAASVDAVTLVDRGTWISFRNRRKLVQLVSGDPALVNRYNVIELDNGTHASKKAIEAQALANWLVSPAGQSAIGAYQIGGETLFHPSAK